MPPYEVPERSGPAGGPPGKKVIRGSEVIYAAMHQPPRHPWLISLGAALMPSQAFVTLDSFIPSRLDLYV
jgi:hypothetical protein